MSTLLTLECLQNQLAQSSAHCLFLDIDGTLSPFEIRPTDSRIPNDTLNLLERLQMAGVPIAVITGRSLAEARQLLHPLQMPMGATHGFELAYAQKQHLSIEPDILAELPSIIEQIQQRMAQRQLSDALLEIKPYSVALHYRQNPALAATVANLMQEVLKRFAHWQLKQGKFVWEILPQGVDKGTAVAVLLDYFNCDSRVTYCPIFIGDDISDEAGFLAVQAVNGMGIKVGEPLEYPSSADFFVPTLNDVITLLEHILDLYSLSDSPRSPSAS